MGGDATIRAPDFLQQLMSTIQADIISLGSTDIQVSPLGIGTWAWGDRLFWGYGSSYGDADLQQVFAACVEAGISFFDTAEIYGSGQSEKLLGSFAADHQDGALDPVVIATKFMPLPWRWSSDSLKKALRDSLHRLGRARVDLYQIHWPLPPISLEVWANALGDAVDAGLTRAVGVSNYSPSQMRRSHVTLRARGIPLASNQVQYSLLCRDPERNGLLDTCQELGITLIAYSPLGMGLLTGKYSPTNPPSGARGLTMRNPLAAVQPLVALLKEIGQAREGKTPAQVALNWVMCKGALPIPGAKTLRQAQDNAGSLGWRLTSAEVAALDQVSDQCGF